MSQKERAARLAALKARLAHYVKVGDEINAELTALGLEKIVWSEEVTQSGVRKWFGGLGRQLRAGLLFQALERVEA